MTIQELLARIPEIPDKSVQFIHETLVQATAVKRKGVNPAHTRLTIVTQDFTPNDAMALSSGGSPQKIGVVVWIPYADYQRMTND